jgi:hypothetical protein
MSWILRAAAAAACVAVVTAAWALADRGTESPPPRHAAAPIPCRARVHHGVLPTWARGGFSDPRPRMPHELGRSGNIAALLFGDPLVSPPRRDHSNKILWVSRLPYAEHTDLRIRAQRMIGGRSVGAPVTRAVDGGPGPSIVDLPAAGCWRLALRWSDERDSIDLRYARGS